MGIKACNKDGGDCVKFLETYPECEAPMPKKIGNGFCDGGLYFTPECGMDGDDCKFCNARNPSSVGNGVCDGGTNLSPGCSMDGGDCDQCFKENTGVNPNKLGDGICHLWLNTTACNYDGQDCIGLTDSPSPSPTPGPTRGKPSFVSVLVSNI